MISAIQTLCSEGKPVRLLLARFADTDMSKNHYNKCLKVRYMKKPLHAKVLIRDHGEAFVGSFNYTKTSLEKNREIGIFLA